MPKVVLHARGVSHLQKKESNPFPFRLYTNYPNPFNPVTRINYEISKKSNVKITVFNILGQEIKVLVNEFKNAGNYSIEFDGKNLPSGLYIYRIKTSYFSDAKKMVLLK